MGDSETEQQDFSQKKTFTMSDNEEGSENTVVRKRLSRKCIVSDSDSDVTEKGIPNGDSKASPRADEDEPSEVSAPVVRRKVFMNSDDSGSDDGPDSKKASADSGNLLNGKSSQSLDSEVSEEQGQNSDSGLRRKKYRKKIKKNTVQPKEEDKEIPSWKKALDSGVFSSGDSDSDNGKDSQFLDEDLEDLGAIKKKAHRQDNKKNGTKEQISHSSKKQHEKRKEDLLKLYSESQKLQRQARVSVPYHKPKQRTLQEFLNMKSLKVTPTHGKSLRMREEELEPVIKQLKDREKEIEEFFKPDSEPEDAADSIIGPTPESVSVVEDSQNPVADSSGFKDDSGVNESIQTSAVQSLDLFDDYNSQVPPVNLVQTSEPGPGSLDLFSEMQSSSETLNENQSSTRHTAELNPMPKTTGETLINGESESCGSPGQETDEDEFSLFIESESVVPKSLTAPSVEPTSPNNAPSSSEPPSEPVSMSDGKVPCEKSVGLPALENCSNFPSLELEMESQELVSRPKLSDRKKALGQLPLITPKLSGRPGQEIELGLPVDDMLELQERFVKHAAARSSPKKKEIQLNVVKKEVASDGKEILKRDVITFKPDDSKDRRANLWQLKGTLRKQLDIKRELEMKKLLEERAKENGQTNDGENVTEESLLDLEEEEEEELSDRDSLADESEEEKNEFLDGEAQEDEDEPEEGNEDEEGDPQGGREGEKEKLLMEENDEGSQKSTQESSLPLDFSLLPSQASVLPGLSQLVDKSTTQSLDDDALMALCSGNFQTQVPQVSQSEGESQATDASLDRPAKARKRISLEDFESEDEEQPESQFLKENDGEEVAEPLDLSSDDEFEKKDIKKRKRIVLSDDEGDEKENMENDDVDSEGEEVAEDVEDEVDDEEKGDVAYDSDENEIAGPLINPKGKLRKEFLENEAELSGSELGSGDENEDGIDEYEEDEGDKEVFDQDELRDQVEKIHLKTILDEDQRDIRLFQEFFLDDGELHTDGPGREKRFRWANLGNDDDDDNVRKDSDDELRDEDGLDVETWRKERHEREQFITSQSQDDAEVDLISSSESQLLLLGKKALQRTKSKTEAAATEDEQPVAAPRPALSIPDSPDFKKKGMPMKRGSFLTFKEDVLTRLAVITKGNPSADDIGKHKGGTAKSTCVFATVTPPNNKEAEKRKKEPDNAGSTPKRVKVKQQRPAQPNSKGKISSIFSHISNS